ncbi:asparagine synthase-related protein [Christiangramia forsetii]|uniref:asparagine synthase (glutamine-hydrolyzing) n=2 Tax=Christiangramia forsetii TaxID=411153 RepID=A0M2X8_CHRFK|nr:asparagine synthase-related protein [Christiangramia forsetii]GGG27278.1 hypothetical protein GCM10011532_08380 [Christiangramia forsetii]CAL66973.1 conserved hypothetical protein [Christiangramia forsetii KT0803]
MSKILYVYFRNPCEDSSQNRKIKSICDNFNPDDINLAPTLLFTSEKNFYGVSNPTKNLKTDGANILLGKLFDKTENWDKPVLEYPDGNYAIFRSDGDKIEVVCDNLGTRCVWYYFNNEIFIASTSQRGIIEFLGDFQFDKSVIPWIISTGSLGPSSSWDKRIKKVPADGSVIIDKTKWELYSKVNPVKFEPQKLAYKEQKNKLLDALASTFKSIKDIDNWNITLSGGHDSRAILLLLKKFSRSNRDKFKTITWGEKNAINDEMGDVLIAQKVARKLNTRHLFFPTELTNENVNEIVEKFLKNGEGRIDHIAGYLDGFLIWKNLYENGVEGIIRGDEVFGYNKIFSPLIVNSFMGLTLCSEFSNLKKYDFIQNLEQEKPNYLLQQNNESIHTWRDRIFHQYRIPYIQSALADLKFAYVEQINPFLSRKIVNVMRALPDDLRTNKKLFKQIMTQLDIDVPYAKRDSNGLVVNIVKQKNMVDLIKKELSSHYAKTIFPEGFLTQVIKNLKVENGKEKIRNKNILKLIKQSLPINFKKFLSRNRTSLILDENVLGFRILIICKMHKKLNKLKDERVSN